ncbi:MAG: hypothetical protein JWN56_1416 [Sphingobacteriales bacterium]|nr:hypothetical protein [Sphingobacteriales bacterium]
MTLAFTLCSNNYLAQAKVLGESFRKYHPDVEFIIGLVDLFHPSVDYTAFENFTIIHVQEVDIPEFQQMEKKYSIVELNTSVKPFYFTHLFKSRKADKIIYLDPDIEIYSNLVEVLDLLNSYNIIITPQNCMPIDDGDLPSDIDLLGTGIFNLGFIALSNHEKIKSFLSWWSDRLVKYAFANPGSNMFFDQIWINLVPVFFDNYYILKHPGYNMAPSNLHERDLTDKRKGEWFVNEEFPLRFYHFSGFKHLNPEIICSYSKRYTLEERDDIAPLYEAYLSSLNLNKINDFQNITPYFCQLPDSPPVSIDKNNYNKTRRAFNRILRAMKVLAGRN